MEVAMRGLRTINYGERAKDTDYKKKIEQGDDGESVIKKY